MPIGPRTLEIPGSDKAFFAAIDVWYETGEASVTCHGGGQASDLRSWRWAEDYFAFGYLGFEFWNRPEFTPASSPTSRRCSTVTGWSGCGESCDLLTHSKQ